MIRVKDIREAMDYLSEGEILTTNASDTFAYKKGKIVVTASGSRYALSPEDFVSLYMHTPFFLYHDDNAIDEEKDEAYYRYYRK